MKSINRSVAVVRPRAPYVTWASSVDSDAGNLEEYFRTKMSVYLIPPDPQEEHEGAPIEQWFAQVFEHELEDWHLDEEAWPQQRDLGTFRDWFEVTVDSVVLDLVEGSIRHNDW